MKTQKNLTLAVYSRIKEMMLAYDIVPGQRLVFIDLARQLGVSRTPVNNALSILANEGYLDFVPNQGYSVHKLTEDEANQLYEIREIFEIGAIGKAIRNMTNDSLETYKKRKLDYEKAISDRVHRKLFILDTEFHAGTIDMIGNPVLAERYRDICQKIFLRFRVEDLPTQRIREVVKEHDELFTAVAIRDVELAKTLIKNHNQMTKKNLFPIIFKKETTERKHTPSDSGHR
ncbi:MAG: GntR family transcriptional regulator [Pseudomonadota bacterium]